MSAQLYEFVVSTVLLKHFKGGADIRLVQSLMDCGSRDEAIRNANAHAMRESPGFEIHTSDALLVGKFSGERLRERMDLERLGVRGT